MLRISEIYKSVQGEGPRVGRPTIFVRFAGCNLRCPGWPCDTQHAIDPEKFRHEWYTVDVGAVVDQIFNIGSTDDNICFTGGEPFLQPNDDLQHLVEDLMARGFTVFEAFSNGTLPYPKWTRDYIYFVMDWKLQGAGEEYNQKLAEARIKNFMTLDGQDAIKFTVKDREDFEEALGTWDVLVEKLEQAKRASYDYPQVYCGPVWGAVEPRDLVDWMQVAGVPWTLNLQIHNMIWDRTARGI